MTLEEIRDGFGERAGRDCIEKAGREPRGAMTVNRPGADGQQLLQPFGNSRANGGCLNAPRHEVFSLRADPFAINSAAKPVMHGEK